MWMVLCVLIAGIVGHHVGALRTATKFRVEAYFKQIELKKTSAMPVSCHYNEGFVEGMRFLIEEVTHDEFHYNDERPGV